MPRTIDIFVNTSKSLEDFIKDIESLINIKLDLQIDEDEVWWEHSTEFMIISIGEHSFENDRDMNFEDYRFHISIRAKNDNNVNDNKRKIIEFGQEIFKKLQLTNTYQLMMVDDMQKKIEEHII